MCVMKMLTCDLVRVLCTFAAFGLAGTPLSGFAGDPGPARDAGPSLVRLPQPRLSGTTSVEAALAARRSLRSFSNKPVTLGELSQLLWAAQGITHPRGLRTAPSAGALYPLELVVVSGTVAALPAGTYRYEPDGHHLVLLAEGDRRAALADAALGQSPIRKAPLVIAIVANERKTTIKYGERGVRYVHLEAGHAAQNICLQAEALGLGSVMIGAFSDRDVASLLRSAGRQPLYLIPLGRK
jgi:SagB-type dehydrogenase family enzyme